MEFPGTLADASLAAHDPSAPLTLLTYNIHSSVGIDGIRDRERVLSVLREVQADIIGLQEVRNVGEHAQAEQFAYFPQITGMHCFACPTLRFHNGQYGNLLLSRWPIAEARLIDLSVAGREPRGAIDALLQVGADRLRIIVTHFGLFPHEQVQQVARLADAIRDVPDVPLVIMGDFNIWGPTRPLLRRIGFNGLGNPALASFPAWSPVIALDRIWSIPDGLVDLRRVHRTVVSRQASDHLPLVARLRLPGAAGAALPAPAMRGRLRDRLRVRRVQAG